ncbi:MAG TPA: tRNA threonylcarbamoyladenosine dehydratase [Clostridia bacterium]|nr:tRNA threonylcarbamoyladenosine dehydratase [Clostridia bacterium]
MKEQFCRSAMLLGEEAIERLAQKQVAVFGIGGVGSFCTEALARAGIGGLTLFDSDEIAVSNINRQIIALHSTVGRPKTEVMRERILDINPDASVEAHQVFYTPENADQFDLSCCDYVVDAIDTVSAKLELIERATRLGVPIISSMGTGNKLDPSCFAISDIRKTSVCPLARVMRYELRRRGIQSLKVLYSTEMPIDSKTFEPPAPGRHKTPGSVSFVPSVAGLMIAGEVIKDLAEGK